MPEYEMTMKLDEKLLPKFKKDFRRIFEKEIMPIMNDISKELFLYDPAIEDGPAIDVASFVGMHSGSQIGLFSLAILENLNSQYLDKGKMNVKAFKDGKISELTITANLSKNAAKKFENLSPGTILKMVSMLDPNKTSAIFAKVIANAKL